MKPRHLVFIISVLALIVLLLSAELLYRKRVHTQLAGLRREVESAHPGSRELDAEFIRFDASAASCEPSLVEDGAAWARSKLGWESGPKLSDHGLNPYLRVDLRFQRGTGIERHVFLWSPRRLRFVYRDIPSDCRQPGCPWSHPSP